MPALTFRVTGRVQGVRFRAWTQKTAAALHLTGWVQNEPDGAVTGLVAGADAALTTMVTRLQDGPRFARVDTVETAPTTCAQPPSGFIIRR